ncbi:endonuclease VIII [Aliifodinibius sp. S!AR15-10]|uniref:endonuclease VIII n=1 Tax=Aliifodinibius sp. S!AR15-10 TaxID=2950437 RepID=UPI00285C40F6|nr:endonuclease VIII [Aliifodinibius sp. S!AR15-10]MDR8391590.1 endonuclease VIII [Aliifodinibius sp. S!AR15-10]
MPEGPEIWREADRLSEVLAGRKVSEIYFAFDELKEYEEILNNREVKTVEPRGKAILTRFDGGLNIYSHNQLYGKWKFAENGERPDTNRSLRLALTNGEHSALLYSASEIEVLTDEQLPEHDYLKKLGPDVLHPDTDYEIVLDRYQDEDFQNRKVATLLLDQSFLSGLGNYLRAEVMFTAGVHPDLKLRQCTIEQKENMAEASIGLARRSFETGGITTDPKTVEALKREGKSRSQYRHFVYGREGDFCYKCGTEIQVDKTGGRKLYYCPECQSKSDK